MNETVAIAGTGQIACGLAVAASRRGKVLVWARSAESIARGRKRVDTASERLGPDDGCDPSQVSFVSEMEALGEADVVVEAIREDPADKRELVAKLTPLVRDDALLASTTSSLSVQEIADASGSPERFIGLHVFNPVPKMKLVELIFPTQATETTKQRARSLCEALDKIAIEVPDTPGFVVNRLLFPAMFSAVEFQDQSGLESKAIDACMELGAGHPMGPLALLDYIGLDTAEAIGDAIGLDVPQSLRDKVRAGHCGKKANNGYYSYD